ncbi:cell death-inducing p53-target protein 1 isoform X2 [Tenrec ecaudatus]|uniref:cell death-inducing p53-target protein 1 isoform X2 n=1 Tax=Tenrec ecaudatus TaxID=94439 RepID=UPI003F5A1C4A
MSNEPPPPYPGGPTAPLLEDKSGTPSTPGRASPAVVQPPPGMPLPPADIGPPPYEPPNHPVLQPGFVPPHVNADGAYVPPGFYPPPGPHAPMGYYPPGPYPPGPYPGPGGHAATVLVPSGAATTVTVLQGEIFEGAPVQTVCPHCQQAVTTKISYEIGLMNFVLGFFCCFMGPRTQQPEQQLLTQPGTTWSLAQPWPTGLLGIGGPEHGGLWFVSGCEEQQKWQQLWPPDSQGLQCRLSPVAGVSPLQESRGPWWTAAIYYPHLPPCLCSPEVCKLPEPHYCMALST